MQERDLDWERVCYHFPMLPWHKQLAHVIAAYLLAVNIRIAIAINVLIITTLILIGIALDNLIYNWVAGIIVGAIIMGTILLWLLHNTFGGE